MKTKKKNEIVVGYARVDISQEKAGLSIDVQEEKIRQYCKEKGYSLSKIFVDKGISGTNLKRPALQQLLVEVSKGAISKVVCFDLTRLSRDTKDYLNIRNLLKKNSVEIETVTGQFSNNNPSSNLFEELITTICTFEAQVSKHRKNLKSQEQPISVDKQKKFKHRIKISVTEKNLNDFYKFKDVLYYGSTCGLNRSQIVLIAKILRLNLENNTEVKAEFQF